MQLSWDNHGLHGLCMRLVEEFPELPGDLVVTTAAWVARDLATAHPTADPEHGAVECVARHLLMGLVERAEQVRHRPA